MTISEDRIRCIIRDELNDHECRIREIEQWRWKAAGAILAISALMTALGVVIAEMRPG